MGDKIEDKLRDCSHDELRRMFRMILRERNDYQVIAKSCAITVILAMTLMVMWVWL